MHTHTHTHTHIYIYIYLCTKVRFRRSYIENVPLGLPYDFMALIPIPTYASVVA